MATSTIALRATAHRLPRCWTCPRSCSLSPILTKPGGPAGPATRSARWSARRSSRPSTALPTWTTARLITEHAALREAIGGAPSHWACYRFAANSASTGDSGPPCIDRCWPRLHAAHPEMGQTVAIDGSDMPAYANGHKHVGNKNGPLRTRYADPDAGWGHRSSISTRKGGAFYGYKLHMAICTATELPLAWTVRAANEPEQAEVRRPAGHGDRARLRCSASPCWTRATTGSRCMTCASHAASGP